jgi:hypothetical protein
MVPRDKPGGLKRWWMTFSASAFGSQPAAKRQQNRLPRTVGCALCFHKPEICGNRAAPEQAFSGTQNDRKNPQAKLIHQIVRKQPLNKLAADMDLQEQTILFLEACYFGCNVASDGRGIVPIQCLQFRRGDDFGKLCIGWLSVAWAANTS